MGVGFQGYQLRLQGWNFQSYILSLREEKKGWSLKGSPMTSELIKHVYAMKPP